MATTVLGNVLEFFGKIGIYDVVLPFMLTFTIVYAILDRTRVLGTEKIGGDEHPKRNLNAMVAFVIGFLVIASSRLVETITSVSSNIVILLLLGVFFLMLVGTFFKEGGLWEEGKGLHNGVKWFFIILMLVGILAIFMNALKTESGQTWLDYSLNYLANNWSSNAVASIILIILVFLFIRYLSSPGAPADAKSGGK
jgi:hypothetical membrane protein